jgi:poly(3-hydroxybutyrate) depolymerase
MRATWTACGLLAAALAIAGDARCEEAHPSKAPDPSAVGQIYTWKSGDGLEYEYYVPKDYDARRGANLLLILHGSNLDRRWGFANHAAGVFRPDDVIVCPDGTTSNKQGGFNFMRDDKDVKRVHALQEELKKTFKIRATYVYGHSQGSFFSFLYAGAYPDEVDGVVGQASGTWAGTAATPKHHRQAIALMHGTADPVVPYFQSVGGLSFYREAKYPMARLRSLEGWNHWPHQDQTAQQLAWCEGMTSSDPARVAASFDFLEQAKDESGFDRDFSALHAVGKRIASLAGAPEDLRTRAAKSVEAVELLARRHADAVAASLGKSRGDKVEDAPWLFHLPAFVRDFAGVPACDALAKEWAPRIDKQRLAFGKSFDEYWRCRQKDPAKALAAGVESINDGFLWCRSADPDFLEALSGWRADSAKLKLGKPELKLYDEVVPAFVSGRKKGFEAYAAINRKGPS